MPLSRSDHRDRYIFVVVHRHAAHIVLPGEAHARPTERQREYEHLEAIAQRSLIQRSLWFLSAQHSLDDRFC